MINIDNLRMHVNFCVCISYLSCVAKYIDCAKLAIVCLEEIIIELSILLLFGR